MNNPQQQQRTVPRRITLLDGTEVTLDVVEGVDIADAVEAYEARRVEQKTAARMQEVAAFAQNIDRTPRPPPQRGTVSPGSISAIDFDSTRGMPDARRALQAESGYGTQAAPSRELLANNAAEEGIDVTTGAPVGLRTLARTVGGADPLRQLELINLRAEDAIKEAGLSLPPGISAVFVEEFTGEPAYYRVERDSDDKPFLVPTLINPPGTDVGDMLEYTPMAMQVAAETFGSGVGAMLGAKGGNVGMTVGAAVGSGTMAAASNWSRQIIARSMGVPEEMVQRIHDDEMFRDVMFAAGGDAAVGTAFAVKRAISNHWFRPLEPETDVAALQQAYRDATVNVQTLEELVGEKIHLTLGMATGDAQVLALEAQAKNAARDWYARRFTQRDISNEIVMGSAVRRINQNAWPTTGGSPPTEVGRRTLENIQEPGRRAGARVERADAAVEAAGRQLPRPDPDVWVNTQTLRNHAAEEFRLAETEAWDLFRSPRGIDVDENGTANIWLRNAPNSPIRKFLNQMGAERTETLSATYRESRDQFLKGLGMDPTTMTKLDEAFPGLSDEALDFNQLHMMLSYLKQQSRRMDNVVPGWLPQDVNDLVSAIERQIHVSPPVYGGFSGLEQMRHDPSFLARAKVDPQRAAFIRDQWDAAKQATTQKHDFENLEALRTASAMRRVPGMPREAVQARTHEFVHQADMVRSVFLRPNNSSALAELKHLEGFSPALRGGLQSELLAAYRQAAFVDGKFSRVASDKFLENHDGHIRLLFGPDGAQAITNVQTMSDAAIRTARRAEQVNVIARQTLGPQVDMAAPPSEVARQLLAANYTPSQVNSFRVRIEKTDPALWDDIQQQGLRWVEEKMGSGGAGKKLNFNQLNRLISGDTGNKLAGIYGRQYVDNLTVLRDVFSLMENAKQGVGWSTNVQTPMLQISRSLLGPLSKKQRFITAMNRAMNSLGSRTFREAMANPQYLQKWVEVQRHAPGSYAAAHAAIGLPRELYMAVDSETRRQANIIRFFQQGGTVQQLERLSPEHFDDSDDGDTDGQ